MIRITNTEPLAEILTYSTVSSMDKAERIATAFLSLSCCRNLLNNQNLIHKYVAAAVYRLAMYMPVPVCDESGEGRKIPNQAGKWRSRVGDVPHLVVLLSYAPEDVWGWLVKDKTVNEYLTSRVSGIEADALKPLVTVMERLLLEGGVTLLADDKFTFKVEKWSVSIIAQPVRNAVLSLKGLGARALLIRCSCDITLLMENSQVGKTANLERIGAKLRYLRNSLNLSQKQMAIQIGIERTAYMRVENGTKISAITLFRCLLYYSRIINLDVLFDEKIWELAQQDQELLYKKVHINSVVHRKHQLMKKTLLQTIENMKQEMDNSMEILMFEFKNGINSILTLTDESN